MYIITASGNWRCYYWYRCFCDFGNQLYSQRRRVLQSPICRHCASLLLIGKPITLPSGRQSMCLKNATLSSSVWLEWNTLYNIKALTQWLSCNGYKLYYKVRQRRFTIFMRNSDFLSYNEHAKMVRVKKLGMLKSTDWTSLKICKTRTKNL